MTSGDAAPRVVVVGSGWRFTSGISYYTCSLVNAMSRQVPTSAVLMRQLVPTLLYPGRKRVGHKVNDLDYHADVDVYDGVDWSWGRSMRGAVGFLDSQAADVVVLQWWTGAVLHSYLRLARRAKRRGAHVVMEWHEVQDTGEARVPGVRTYVEKSMRLLLRHVDAHVVHSTYDLDLLEQAYAITAGGATATVIHHGPYDHVAPAEPTSPVSAATEAATEVAEDAEDAEDRPFHLLYFGVIRPYKGLEDLVAAFERLPAEARDNFRLTIVGETWEGWDAPLAAVEVSPARERIDVINRYVSDAEAQQHFAAADAVVLPYRRSSSSGPLHMAMSAGLPVVVSSVGGLVEAAADYDGVSFVPPRDISALTAALLDLPALRGRRFADVRSWATTVASYRQVFSGLDHATRTPTTHSTDSTDSTDNQAGDVASCVSSPAPSRPLARG